MAISMVGILVVQIRFAAKVDDRAEAVDNSLKNPV